MKIIIKKIKSRILDTINNKKAPVRNGDVVIAAITSCTNTSNPSVMISAGLLAKKALEKGIMTKPWVKTSLAPGSQVVMDYLEKSKLIEPLESLGFHLVGYGCTTCIGNSGPLNKDIEDFISQENLVVASVLSGNRNFEGRIHPKVKLNYLASPPLVVSYALTGSMTKNILTESLSKDKKIYLKDIWPTNEEVQHLLEKSISASMFKSRYDNVFKGDKLWESMPSTPSTTYKWDKSSTYVKKPSFFQIIEPNKNVNNIKNARILALLGDSVTTDHISPAGSIKSDSPAGEYLQKHGVSIEEFNSYGSRRGNHEVMVRGTFANIRLKNEIIKNSTGGITKHFPSEEIMSIYDASERYKEENIPLIVIGGKEYGTGSSRDWAAKGTKLLGVKAVITESFERIHRSNLIGMGVLPLVFENGINKNNLNLDGSEILCINGLDKESLIPNKIVDLIIKRNKKIETKIQLKVRLDTPAEVEYYISGGILNYVLKHKIESSIQNI